VVFGESPSRLTVTQSYSERYKTKLWEVRDNWYSPSPEMKKRLEGKRSPRTGDGREKVLGMADES
jgi:hypothetical protein